MVTRLKCSAPFYRPRFVRPDFHRPYVGRNDPIIIIPGTCTLTPPGEDGCGNPMTTLALSHFDGSDGETVILDDKLVAEQWTLAGNTQLDTTIKKWDTASLEVQGAGQGAAWLGAGNDVLLLDETCDWTYEGWAYTPDPVTSFNALNYYLGPGLDPNHHVAVVLAVPPGVETTGAMTVLLRDENEFQFGSLAAVTPSLVHTTWHHWAVVRFGIDYYLYLNGFRVAALTEAQNVGTCFTPVYAPGATANTYVDDLRVSQGARYREATYVVPAGPFVLD